MADETPAADGAAVPTTLQTLRVECITDRQVWGEVVNEAGEVRLRALTNGERVVVTRGTGDTMAQNRHVVVLD